MLRLKEFDDWQDKLPHTQLVAIFSAEEQLANALLSIQIGPQLELVVSHKNLGNNLPVKECWLSQQERAIRWNHVSYWQIAGLLSTSQRKHTLSLQGSDVIDTSFL
ncbi:hypothetical protein CEXT_217531 [Caerostris extrusa]|uniref:Uncharacterized protein n=1 Tax=Caerostris extrusa TaxID=172846 RepID=A0AAV4N455_CAEEX|nr:hypothetical protein CEXT_217531 [Caerostris extrusa]